jgi:hypothetical protein
MDIVQEVGHNGSILANFSDCHNHLNNGEKGIHVSSSNIAIQVSHVSENDCFIDIIIIIFALTGIF